MRIKKFAAFAAAMVMAAGVCTGVPVGDENKPLLTINAEAAESDFVIKTDYFTGKNYVAGYNGKGGDIIIPDSVSSIGEEVFAGNKTITSVTFPKSCSLQYRAFAACTNLKKVTFEGDAEIGQLAFERCINLEEVIIKGSINQDGIGGISEAAFCNCQSLKKVTISKNEYEFAITDNAFAGCVSLQSINIPGKCYEINSGAFRNCFSLSKIAIPENTELYEQCLGYSVFYKSVDDFMNDAEEYGDNSLNESLAAAVDGKSKCYYYIFKNNLDYSIGEYTPRQITVTVAKDSPAEKYCKENGIKYVYASTSSSAAAAPANFRASITSSSITLSWDKVDGADVYSVYKLNPETNKYEKYKDVTETKCAVTDLKADTKYKFKVVPFFKKDGKYVQGEISKGVTVSTKK